MNEVPLIQEVRKNDINTSIIAIKKQFKQLIEAVGFIESPNAPDLSPYVKKADVTDVVEVGNTNPVTSNGVAIAIEESIAENIVDVVENDNLKAVTSNAVANSLSYSTEEVKTGGIWIDDKPIYRSIITSTSGDKSYNWFHMVSSDIPNVDTYVSLKAIMYHSGNLVTISALGTYYLEGGKYYHFLDNYTSETPHSAIAIIEYTKTTDV